MKTNYYKTRLLVVALVFALLASACERIQKVKVERVEAEDWLAAALGWSDYEALSYGSQGPMLIAVTDDSDENQYLLAYPAAAAIVGDKMLSQMREVGAASAIGPGEAYAARLQTSLYAIQQAFQGAPLSQLWVDPSERYIAAMLPQGNAWFLGFVDTAKRSMFTICSQLQNCGLFVNASSANELAQAMKANGWKLIAASQIPAGVKSYFLYRMGWLGKAWFVQLRGVVASPVIVPGGAFLIPESIVVPGQPVEKPQQ